MTENKNQSIASTVNKCPYHAQNENYCTLDYIQVGTDESNPSKVECTDCQSFRYKM